MAAGQIFVGTAGWSYPDWEGVVYPVGATDERLPAVAECLDCVEVDSTFYRPATARTTGRWLQRVQAFPQFRFLAKAWQRFTHERIGRWTRAEFEFFAGGLLPLHEAGRLEALLFQFPWSFRNESVNRDWLARLAEDFTGWPIAVEVRHDSWATDEVPELFRRQGFTYCNIDQPVLAHCLGPTAQVTSATGYFRLHGRNAANWFREKQEVYGGRYDYLYSDAELGKLLPLLRRLAAQSQKTFVVFNNHKDGKAFANALQLKVQLAGGVPVRAPVSLVDRYPMLRGQVRTIGQDQLSLG
jgi:uncharacterized protein YecE (DUF72 family)